MKDYEYFHPRAGYPVSAALLLLGTESSAFSKLWERPTTEL